MGIPRILLADDHHEMLEKVAHLLEGNLGSWRLSKTEDGSLKLLSTWTPGHSDMFSNAGLSLT